ncbi:BTAD domain-containing putative transcriptional regulator [Umezawaea endophytica]|uniref:Tetratricopeptide repeat protein n=1 Tax=Umezawaea endophytica TaxID=1654476 RepID=A0A9X2VX56_9PSEU|nr:BTAD domain-containing putative transcriptional regulator [Umezawaea endophytica]MCS7483759.1 tetratricopeptide repeat protein [Umezawaea endophytica]
MGHEGLGEVVAARRRAAVITQRELAERAGLSVGAVRDIEQGRTRSPRPAAIRSLGAVLGLTAEELAPHIGSPLRLSVLGPLEVSVRAQPVDLGSVKQRAVLAVLALSPNTAVHRDAIVEAVWGGSTPDGSAGLISTYVSQLRRALRVERPVRRRELLVSEGRRYRLVVGDDEHDLLEFRSLVRRAEDSGDPEVELDLLARAARLFRGEPLADFEDLRSLPEIAAIRFERVESVLALADVGLALGRPEVVLPRLRRVADAEPLHSGVQARLMLVLAADGQAAAALRVFETARQGLADELGLDPDGVLLAARQRVLRQELSAASAPPVAVPAQLPPDTPDFTGRRVEITRLCGLLTAPRRTTAVCAITGAGGMGKTTLATHVGHRVRHLFPDGQLHLDLRGTSRDAVPSSEALAEALRALGVPPSSLPNTERERVTLYRSVLADRKVLVVLDDARDPAHVRPLLPGSAGSAVLITSRHNMAVLPGVRTCGLDPLSEAESVALLCRVAGSRDTAGARSQARRCGGMPLALRVAGARAGIGDGWAAAGGLAEFEVDDLSVATSVGVSVDLLDDRAATLFRTLGLLESPRFTAPVAARLLDVTETDAATALAALTRVHLVDRRLGMHDLVRLYAAERAATEPEPVRRAALRRVLRWYLVSARRASLLVMPSIRMEDDGAEDESGAPLATVDQALAWLESERTNLMSLQRQALSDLGLDDLGVLLVRPLQAAFNEWGVSERWEENLRLAREVTRRTGDLARQGYVVRALARSVGCYDLAASTALYVEAIGLYRAAGDHANELHVRINLGVSLHNSGDLAGAVSCYEDALAGVHADDRRVEGYALVNLAAAHRDLGRADLAADHDRRALAVAQDLGDRHLEFDVTDDLACTYRALADYPAAVAVHEAALKLVRELNDPIREAIVHSSLGRTLLASGDAAGATGVLLAAVAALEESGEDYEHGRALHLLGRANLATGDGGAARSCLRRAMALLTRLKSQEADDVRALLDEITPTG